MEVFFFSVAPYVSPPLSPSLSLPANALIYSALYYMPAPQSTQA